MPKPRYLIPSDLLGPGEVCRALGVSKMALSRWRAAGKFPEPWAELDMGPVWLRVDVEKWDQNRPRSKGSKSGSERSR